MLKNAKVESVPLCLSIKDFKLKNAKVETDTERENVIDRHSIVRSVSQLKLIHVL
jgi:hypothetical protein